MCALIITGIFPLASSAAIATESSVQTKIANFKKLFPDESYFTTTGTNVCKKVTQSGSASWCSGGTSCETCRLEYLFSNQCTNSNIKAAISQVPALTNIPKGRASCCGFATFAFCYIFEHDYLTNSTAISTANAGITDKFLSSLKPGDLVKCYTSMTSTSASHWAIFLGYDSNYVYFYESNNLRPNRVEYNNSRPRNGLKLKSDGSWVKLVAFRSNTHTSKLTVNDTYKVTASDGFLAIRSTYSTSGTQLGTIPTGATFTVTKYDEDGNWGYVTYNGISGWSCLYNVELVNSSSNSSTGTIESQPVNNIYCINAPDGFVAFRTQPTTSSTKISEITTGKYITVTQLTNDGKYDWGYTSYNGQSGWVCLYYTIQHKSHSYGNWQTVTAATCTTTGSQKRSCACGATEMQSVSSLGHSYSTTWTTDTYATCTTNGSKSHHCTRCNAKTDQTIISSTGHSYNTWSTVKAPTCTALGTQSRTCTVCNNGETKSIAALGHNYSSSWTTDVSPTCTTAGTKSHHCTRCDIKTDITTIPSAGHSWNEWVIIVEATTDSTGTRIRTCKNSGCTTKESAVIAKLPEPGHTHTFEDWHTDTPATCTEDGISSRNCTLCSEFETLTISAKGHNFGEWATKKEATTENEGIMERTCNNCNKSEYLSIPKLTPVETETPSTEIPGGNITDIVTANPTATPTENVPTVTAPSNDNNYNNDSNVTSIALILVSIFATLLLIILAILIIKQTSRKKQ